MAGTEHLVTGSAARTDHNTFLTEYFLLETEAARRLYHDYASKMPIIDYHNHLPPAQVAQDKYFDNLAEIWLGGDHYKWRAMRTNGVTERYCTGSASDYEKFEQWAATVPYTVRNPLYHWTHMELRKPFGIDKLLNPETAPAIYEETKQQLREKWGTRALLDYFHVKVICTTDDPADDLRYHRQLKDEGFHVKVLPTFRPDQAMAVEDPQVYNQYIDRLAEAANQEIKSYDDLLDALQKRHNFFAEMGCRLSDHGIEAFEAEPHTLDEIKAIFSKVRQGKAPETPEARKFRSALLYEICKMNHARGWAQQFHVGAQRSNNTRYYKLTGKDTGFDAIGNGLESKPMARFFDWLDQEEKLTKTIVYNLNPGDNAMVASLLGAFNDSTVPGKMQFGSAWWFLDQKDGMEEQMNTLSRIGLISRFVGMLTDSRSFLSFSRHEYFRRILCNLFGRDMQNGEIPNDEAWVGSIIQDICYNNAKEYFGV